MPRFAKARDANEKEIVAALIADGWSVERIEPVGRNNGLPDLILGKGAVQGCGITTTAEVKREPGPRGGRKDKCLTENQEEWHDAWLGARPLVLDCPPEEAVRRCNAWLRDFCVHIALQEFKR